MSSERLKCRWIATGELATRMLRSFIYSVMRVFNTCYQSKHLTATKMVGYTKSIG